MLIGKRIPWRHGMKLPNGLIHVFGKSDTEIVQSVPPDLSASVNGFALIPRIFHRNRYLMQVARIGRIRNATVGSCVADMPNELPQGFSLTFGYFPLGPTLANKTVPIGSLIANFKILLTGQYNHPKK